MAAEPPAPGVGPEVRRLALPAGAAALSAARAEIMRLPGVPAPTRRDLLLVLDELVGNALRHSRAGAAGPIEVAFEVHRGLVRAEVHDPGPGFDPGPPALPGREATSGRGLVLVAQVADRWGTARTAGRFAVWVELWSGRARSSPAHPVPRGRGLT